MKHVLALMLLAGAVQASAQTVESAKGNWDHLPQLRRSGTGTVTALAVVRIHQIVATGECTLPGQSKKKLDMSVDFAVQYAPDGKVQRVVLQKLGCAEVEGIIGGQVLALLESEDFKPTGANDDGWYQGQLYFSSTG